MQDLEPLQEIPISSETKASDPVETPLVRETEIKVEWDHRSNNPNNKPLDPSVTEEYHTKGGKEIRAVHDDERSLWHIEFTSGGILPRELKGQFTGEPTARHAIRQYLAKSE